MKPTVPWTGELSLSSACFPFLSVLWLPRDATILCFRFPSSCLPLCSCPVVALGRTIFFVSQLSLSCLLLVSLRLLFLGRENLTCIYHLSLFCGYLGLLFVFRLPLFPMSFVCLGPRLLYFSSHLATNDQQGCEINVLQTMDPWFIRSSFLG